MPEKKLVDPRDLPKHPAVDEDEEGAEVEEEEIDAWPTHELLDEEEEASPADEAGLSVDPEDLARHWLNQATEQGNFESSRGDSDSGIHIINVHTKT